MHLWRRIIDQEHITLNMLRPSRINQNISAHAMMEGNFDFNKTPLAPPVTKAKFHENPNSRCTRGKHGVQFWYKGPAFEPYQCYKVNISNT